MGNFLNSIRVQTKREENIYGTLPDTDRSSDAVITQYGGVSNLDILNRDTMEPEIMTSVTRYADQDDGTPKQRYNQQDSDFLIHNTSNSGQSHTGNTMSHYM